MLEQREAAAPPLASVTRERALGVFRSWRSTVGGAHRAEFDAAVRAVEQLPTARGADGKLGFGPPVQTPAPAAADSPRPAPRSYASDPVLHHATAVLVQQLVLRGGLRRMSVPARVVWHPLMGVPKHGDPRAARLIADLRRANAGMREPPHFSLPSFHDVLCWPGARWGMKLDLASAFYSVGLDADAARTWMATALPDGTPVFWHGMPMGWSWAPFVFQTLLGPLRVLLAAHGVRVINYLDDFLVVGDSERETWRGAHLLADAVHELGFVVSTKKTSPCPSQSLEFLGMGVALDTGEFFWPREKAERVQRDAARLLATAPQRVAVLELQRLLGRVAFLTQVCPLAAAWRRALDGAVARAGSASFVALTDADRTELRFWASASSSLAGTTFPFRFAGRVLVRTDASEHAAGVRVRYDTGAWYTYTVLLPAWLRGESSGARELWATLVGLEVVAGSRLLRPRMCVDTYTDSQVARAAAAGRARTLPMVAMSRDMLAWQRRHEAVVDPHWLRRDEMQLEDAASRVASRAHARLDRQLLQCLVDVTGEGSIAVDAFATAANAAAATYFTATPEPGATGVDGLVADLDAAAAGGLVYAFPPFALARRALRRLSRDRSPALAVVPRDMPCFIPTEAIRIDIHLTHTVSYPPSFSTSEPAPQPLTAILLRCPRGPTAGGSINLRNDTPTYIRS